MVGDRLQTANCVGLWTTCTGYITKPAPVVKYPDIKVHGANVGPTRGRHDPGGPHVGHINFAIWAVYAKDLGTRLSSAISSQLVWAVWFDAEVYI